MSAPAERLTILNSWVTKAEEDLSVADRIVAPAAGCPTASVCFHAQQCVEKYVKALLVWREVAFPKTHDLQKLMQLLTGAARIGLTADEADQLTDYATASRYPGDQELLTHADALKALQAARRVRRNIRKLLPQEALNN